MRYEVRTENPDTPEVQYVIWDTYLDTSFARFAKKETADDLINRWTQAQMLAESKA